MSEIPSNLALPENHRRRGRGRNVQTLRIAGIMALLVILAASTLVSDNPLLLIIVAAMATVCFMPTLREWQRSRLDVFAPVNVVAYLWFIFFGLGSIWVYTDPEGVAYDKYIVPYVTTAAWYCLLGIVAMMVGYYMFWRPVHGSIKRAIYRIHGVPYLVLVVGLGAIGGFAEIASHRLHFIGAALGSGWLNQVAQLAPLNRFAWALCWLLLFSGLATSAQRRLLLLVFLPFQIAIVATSLSDKSVAGTLAGIPLVALWYTRGKLPWRSLLALFLVLVFVVFPLFNTFRQVDPRLSFGQRLQATGVLISEWTGEEYLDRSVDVVKERLSLVNSVAVVIRDVPRWVPYANGRTLFVPTLAFLVPRVLWPGKPTLTMGTDFARTFRVVHMLDYETNMAVTVPGELCWNFSWPGIVVGMLLWGAALRWVYRRYYEGLPFDVIRVAILIVTLVEFAHFGASLAGQIANLMRTLLILEFLQWVSLRLRLLSLEFPRSTRTAE
ncbi:MAG: hypothetical protein OEV00_01990 [Acidobacteriota bacterium]|nr:hypothetical protein [Acidobacteriota bacterium]MDH3784078.1 hypothetical protein [Acidobacteriota bacterium]